MRTPVRLGAFAAGLAAVFATSLGLGRLAGPVTAPAPAAHADGGHGSGGHQEVDHTPGGLQVEQDGYRLEPLTGTLTDGAPLRFRITGPDGRPVTGYTISHDKELHLIAVRRDLAGFQHVHPSRDADGTWSVPLRVPAAGQYRIFADFRPQGRAEGLTLGVDLPAPGDYRPVPLPAATRTTTVDGYTVTLDGDLHAGTASGLGLTISRDGVPVRDLEPYLGASGHLVALRQGDLAYLHVHPDEGGGAGPRIGFTAEVPSTGAYRLYLDFKHGGTVHTAEFTAVAEH